MFLGYNVARTAWPDGHVITVTENVLVR